MIEDDMIWLERYLRNNFGRSNKMYKIMMAMREEIERLKEKAEKPKRKKGE